MHPIIIDMTLDRRRITAKLKGVLSNPHNQVIVSAISFWEISLKSSLGKLQLQNVYPQDLPAICVEMSFLIEPLEADICSSYHQLSATWHNDLCTTNRVSTDNLSGQQCYHILTDGNIYQLVRLQWLYRLQRNVNNLCFHVRKMFGNKDFFLPFFGSKFAL